MSLSNPVDLPTLALIVPFILLYAAIFHTVAWLLGNRRGEYFSTSDTSSQRRVPTIVTTTVVVLLALQSIGQLTPRDVIAVFLVVALGYFYLYRNGVRQIK